MLKIQEFLRAQDPRSAIRKAVEKWGLEVNESEYLVQLNYSQIDSPKGVVEAEECRGLILEKLTWNVVSYPFRRFYNHSEGHAAKVNLNSSVLFEKVDGSLIELYHYKDKWRVATRGRLDASGSVGSAHFGYKDESRTFSSWFWEVAKKVGLSVEALFTDLNYVFEITGKANRVLTPYTEDGLRLLTVRDTKSLREADLINLVAISEEIGVPTPKVFEFKNTDHINNMLSMMPALDEGFVLCDYGQESDGSWLRVKIKNPAYLAATRIVGGGFNDCKCLDLVLSGKSGEFANYFPEYRDVVNNMEAKTAAISTKLDDQFAALKPLAEKSRKDFALAAVKTPAPSVMFGLLDGRFASAMEGLKELGAEKAERIVMS